MRPVYGRERKFVHIKENFMAKKSIFIVVAAALLSTVCVAGAFAQDDSKAGASAQSKPKAVTIGAGFAMSSRPQIEVNGSPQTDSGGGAGINVFGDYRLPIGVPLSLGLESGFSSSDVTPGDGSLTVIPILFRVGYHFNPGTKLDFYLVGKIGYAMGKIDVGGQIDESMSGLAFGFDVGVAYYFIPSVGAFLEVGVTRYGLETDIEEQGQSATIEAPFNHFLTLGIAFRF
jgi:opacity protein-like surface antigen